MGDFRTRQNLEECTLLQVPVLSFKALKHRENLFQNVFPEFLLFDSLNQEQGRYAGQLQLQNSHAIAYGSGNFRLLTGGGIPELQVRVLSAEGYGRVTVTLISRLEELPI